MSIRADFSQILHFECPDDWQPNHSKECLRLPKRFYINENTIYWVQDVVNFSSETKMVSPFINVLKYEKRADNAQEGEKCQFGRWSCGVSIYAAYQYSPDDCSYRLIKASTHLLLP